MPACHSNKPYYRAYIDFGRPDRKHLLASASEGIIIDKGDKYDNCRTAVSDTRSIARCQGTMLEE